MWKEDEAQRKTKVAFIAGNFVPALTACPPRFFAPTYNSPYLNIYFFILQKNYVLTIVRVNLKELVTQPMEIAIATTTLLGLAVPSRLPQTPNVNLILIVQKINFVVLMAVFPLQQSAKIHVQIVMFVVMVRNAKLRTERQYAHVMVQNGLEIRIHTW